MELRKVIDIEVAIRDGLNDGSFDPVKAGENIVGITKGICTLCKNQIRNWGNRTGRLGLETIHDLVERIVESGPECGLVLIQGGFESLKTFTDALEL